MRHALLVVAFLASAATASAQSPPIPQTPAGRLMGEWIEAFNSGDRTEILAVLDRYGRAGLLDPVLSLRNRIGGIDLISIESSTPEAIEFVASERTSPMRALWRVAVSGDPPRAMVLFQEIPAEGADLEVEIDAATRDAVIDSAIAKLRQYYVFAEGAEAMAEAVERRRRNGEYDGITSGVMFATLLANHLRDVSHDLHLDVDFNPVSTPRPTDDPAREREAAEEYRREMARTNCGFHKVEILEGNVGYLKFNTFGQPDVCGPTLTAAMNFLEHVEALIVDLRENGGGAATMVGYALSYLFEEPTHLIDTHNRAENRTHQWWTSPYVAGGRLTEQPVYVLTARRTFSGAEEFAFSLKSLGRATIVGEVTGGGAHRVRDEWLTEHFTIRVPYERALDPVTGTNWEGTGVEPDVAVPAAEALEKALELIAARRTDSRH